MSEEIKQEVQEEQTQEQTNDAQQKAVGFLSKFFCTVNIPLYYALFILVAATTLVVSVNVDNIAAIMVGIGGVAILFFVMFLLYKLGLSKNREVHELSVGKIALYIIIPLIATVVVLMIVIMGMIAIIGAGAQAMQ